MQNLRMSSSDQTHCKLRGMAGELSEEQIIRYLVGAYAENVSKHYRQFIPTTNIADKFQKVCNWLIRSRRNGLLLYGRVGAGKTVMALSISRILRCGRSYEQVIYKTSGDLAELFQSNRDFFHQISLAEVVIIDDLGCEPADVNIYGTIYSPFREFIHKRYARNLITVISTNLDNPTLMERYGERVWDRMYEMFDRIIYTEESYRRM